MTSTYLWHFPHRARIKDFYLLIRIFLSFSEICRKCRKYVEVIGRSLWRSLGGHWEVIGRSLGGYRTRGKWGPDKTKLSFQRPFVDIAIAVAMLQPGHLLRSGRHEDPDLSQSSKVFRHVRDLVLLCQNCSARRLMDLIKQQFRSVTQSLGHSFSHSVIRSLKH